MKKILVVGQTPPPYGGQAVMIESMLKFSFQRVKLYHARMDFSEGMDEIGKFKFAKIVKLLYLIGRIYFLRFRHGISTLYYPPAPPNTIPVVRDIIILNATRWLFKSTIFHFHAAGVSELYAKFSGILKKLYEWAYFYPDVCIRLSEFNPEDGKIFRTGREYIVPNGLPDAGAAYLEMENKPSKQDAPIKLLYVGLLCETKGVLVLLESMHYLVQAGHPFVLQLVGRFESVGFQQRVEQFIVQKNLGPYVELLGVRTGEEKHKTFAHADIFCYPTFFEAETFGLVALEAMQFGLPVVATRWRGVPSVVVDQVSGFIVPPQDANAFADKLALLIEDESTRKLMGKKGREIYCQKFTAQRHFALLEVAFTN
ncbi:MAG: glycosyltransferase family 4 protein [Tunicatimonas sp.]